MAPDKIFLQTGRLKIAANAMTISTFNFNSACAVYNSRGTPCTLYGDRFPFGDAQQSVSVAPVSVNI